MSVTRDRFCMVGASTTVHCPEFRDVRYSGAVNILFYRTFSWYMDYCPLFYRHMSAIGGVRYGESTVYINTWEGGSYQPPCYIFVRNGVSCEAVAS